MAAYFQSKLALIMLTYGLANESYDYGVLVNALHPGNVRSNFNNG